MRDGHFLNALGVEICPEGCGHYTPSDREGRLCRRGGISPGHEMCSCSSVWECYADGLVARTELAELRQMCSAPSDAYSAGAWCEAANALLAIIDGGIRQAEYVKALNDAVAGPLDLLIRRLKSN